MIKSSNPALSTEVFRKESTVSTSEVMSLEGTVNKTGLLLLCVVGSAAWTWGSVSPQALLPLSLLSGIGGFVVALITHFKKHLSGITAPIYAILQGLFLGAISYIFEMQYPGIVMQAVGLTFGTLFALLGAYKSGMIKATENFKLGVAAATGGIFLFYLVGMILSMFGFQLNVFYGNGLMGIGFSVIVVTIAALNLVMDFDFIENGVEYRSPKYMEWYAAFGLMVTLIWLYIEILRLLSKLQSRRD